MIAYKYNPDANPQARFIPGVPLADITAHVLARLTEGQRLALAASGWYTIESTDTPAQTAGKGKVK